MEENPTLQTPATTQIVERRATTITDALGLSPTGTGIAKRRGFVSVVIFFNEERFLDEAVTSVYTQTDPIGYFSSTRACSQPAPLTTTLVRRSHPRS